MKRLTIGLLAHVDAGKTTLSEAVLYRTGAIRSLGRVDHRDAFLDTEDLERERGITIFSKQAVFPLTDRGTGTDREVTLLDTPGHVDFAAEMERALQGLDCAVLVVSGSDGVQAHTLTLWRLLEKRRLPVFLFVNKMDLAGTDREALLAQLKARLGDGFADFGAPEESVWEEAATADEEALTEYLDAGSLSDETLGRLIASRAVFPCWFGSALKLTGVDEFLAGLARYAPRPSYPEDFAARVYKIGRDPQGARLTYMKITGGSLRVKGLLSGADARGERWEEKAESARENLLELDRKLRSILSTSKGVLLSVLREEYPEPKSSIRRRKPLSLASCIISFIFTFSMDSVISSSRSSLGMLYFFIMDSSLSTNPESVR